MAEGRQRRGKPRQMQYSMMTDSYRQGVRPSLIKPIMHIAYPPISAKFINSPYFPKIYKFHPYFHQTYKFPPISAKFISSSPFWFFGLNLRFWLPLFLTWCIYISYFARTCTDAPGDQNLKEVQQWEELEHQTCLKRKRTRRM